MIELVFYDMEDDRLRTKAAKLLKKHGYIRIQYSVFIGNVRKSTRRIVTNKLTALLDKSSTALNKIYFLEIHEDRVLDMRSIGDPPPIDIILGRVKTLIW